MKTKLIELKNKLPSNFSYDYSLSNRVFHLISSSLNPLTSPSKFLFLLSNLTRPLRVYSNYYLEAYVLLSFSLIWFIIYWRFDFFLKYEANSCSKSDLICFNSYYKYSASLYLRLSEWREKTHSHRTRQAGLTCSRLWGRKFWLLVIRRLIF